MLNISDVDSQIARQFGSRLEASGFQQLGKRKWVRSQKLPIRELFVIGALKGGLYSPIWGISSGLAPSLHRRGFRRQSTEKNAVMDLVIDPIDLTAVPAYAFGFIPGYDSEIYEPIQRCAEHFVPLALTDFDRVRSIPDFCRFFLERRELKYQRFTFDMYVQHQLVYGFVLLLNGQRDAGLAHIRKFCVSMEAEVDDRVLAEYIDRAQSSPAV